MELTEQNEQFAVLIGLLQELSDKDLRAAIRIARQYRRADKSLHRTLERQQKAFMLSEQITDEPVSELSYEHA